MNPSILYQKAYTMLELIFVILILGIVASIGSSIIANVYDNYLLQRATHRASLKTELAAQQIANLLTHRIPNTTIARNPNNWADNVYVYDPTIPTDANHTALEWIGEDFDGFSTSQKPAWSGFCDVAASNQTKIITPASKLTLAFTIMHNLGLATGSYPAIFFRHSLYSKEGGNDIYYSALTSGTNQACMGLVDTNTSCISSVSQHNTSNRRLDFQTAGSASKKVISENYKLAWTAYAIIPFRPNTNTVCAQGESPCDLRLFYNYQPWEGERLDNALSTISSATILTNVTVFKFAESGNTFRFKLCSQENIGDNYNVTICKEKAVIR
jgi:prepilin-type N-terminal cleavage/methylation domain-containing protein